MIDVTDPNDFCEALANAVFHDRGITSTYLGMLRADATVETVGAWGYPMSGSPFYDRPSLWQPMAVTDALRSGELHIFDSWAKYVRYYPHLDGLHTRAFEGLVAIPFLHHGRRTGCIALSFSTTLAEQDLPDEFWPVLADAANLLVSVLWDPKQLMRSRGEEPPAVQDFEAKKVRDSLTGRETRVLQLVAAGLTTRQVARLLHLSESSIKQTRMSLGRKLGVKRRVDLEFAARALGLDAPDETELSDGVVRHETRVEPANVAKLHAI